jgi:hypothetical protein
VDGAADLRAADADYDGLVERLRTRTAQTGAALDQARAAGLPSQYADVLREHWLAQALLAAGSIPRRGNRAGAPRPTARSSRRSTPTTAGCISTIPTCNGSAWPP